MSTTPDTTTSKKRTRRPNRRLKRQKIELAEIKEAFDIMSHPEARIYYNLYALKPPSMIKHQQNCNPWRMGSKLGRPTRL